MTTKKVTLDIPTDASVSLFALDVPTGTKVLMNVRVVVTQEGGDDGPCQIRAFEDGVLMEQCHVPELPRDEVGDTLVDTMMYCAVASDLAPPEDVPVDERPRMKTGKGAIALRKASAMVLVNDQDLWDEAIEVDGETFFVSISKDPPKA